MIAPPLLSALLLATAPADTAPMPLPPAAEPSYGTHRGAGSVVGVTASGRAYLDAGSEDGLSAGGTVVLRRGAESPGHCTIETIAPHYSVCTGAPARVGDTFELAPLAETPAPRLLPPPPPEEVLGQRRVIVESVSLAPVVFQATSEPSPVVLPRRTQAIDLSLTTQNWSTSPGGRSSKESLDVLARGVPLASWLYLDVDARLEYWASGQPPVFRPNTATQFYVWQAQLTALPSDTLSIAAGRVFPWGVPGATVFDGAMVSTRGTLWGSHAEGGLIAGVVPEPNTVQFDTQRATAGGYWVLDRRVGEAVFRTEGRLAAVRTPELGTRGEASLTGRWFQKTFEFSGEANLGAGGTSHAPGFVDSARLDATVRPATKLSVGGSFQYAGLDWPQTFYPPAFPGRSREADAFLTWDVVRWLRLSALGGYSEDLGSSTRREWLGPEAAFPRVLWGWGTPSAGYLKEGGWMAGQSAYAQLVATPWKPVWLLARVAWSEEETQGPLQDELSATLGARGELTQHVALRLSFVGRTGFDPNVTGESRPSSLSAFATLLLSY
ncbi:MAG TPA: hypothetical protein VFG53_01485 [Anaeromyxobacter sp.]|nr:hypothetical protein [Anaeromyxobacter sp.]